MKVVELGNGLEIWKVPVKDIKEQDINARSMNAKMFERLMTTIKRDARLESLPLCATTPRGIEVVSGHHRLRAAIAAGLAEVFAIMDVTGLSPDEIKAKQLAHNAIQGEDNEQIVAQIFNEIKDAEAKLEAFIDQSIQPKLDKVKIDDIDLKLDYRSVLVVFLPHEKEKFEKIAELIAKQNQELYLAELSRFEQFKQIVSRISREYEIRSMGTILTKMADIAAESLGEEVEQGERVSLRDIFKSAYIPTTAADTVIRALEKMKQAGDVTGKNLWQALEYWAAEHLAS